MLFEITPKSRQSGGITSEARLVLPVPKLQVPKLPSCTPWVQTIHEESYDAEAKSPLLEKFNAVMAPAWPWRVASGPSNVPVSGSAGQI